MMAPTTSPISSRNWQRVTGLLGEAIYEIQLSWTGPEELKQANYALWSHAQRVKIPKGGAHHGVSKGHGTHGHP